MVARLFVSISVVTLSGLSRRLYTVSVTTQAIMVLVMLLFGSYVFSVTVHSGVVVRMMRSKGS